MTNWENISSSSLWTELCISLPNSRVKGLTQMWLYLVFGSSRRKSKSIRSLGNSHNLKGLGSSQEETPESSLSAHAWRRGQDGSCLQARKPETNPGNCHFLLQCVKVKSESEIAQSCPTLCDPMDCSLPCSSIHGIFQARVLDWVAISFSKGSSWPRDQTQVSCIIGRCFTVWATYLASLYNAISKQPNPKVYRRLIK